MDDLDIAVNSIDLALEHPDLVTDLEPTDILLEHPDIIEPIDRIYDIVSEHPKIALNPTDLDIEPTDLVLEHPKVIVEPDSIEVEPGDIVLEHPKIAYTSNDIDVEPDEIALEHFKVAVGPNYIKVEPNDIALEHPKIVTDDLALEPNDLVVEHPKMVVKPPDIDIEPDDLVVEHPKVLVRDKQITIEPTDLAIEHPAVVTKLPEINVEPTDIALEHPDLANLPIDDLITPRRNQKNKISSSTESSQIEDPNSDPHREFEVLKSTSQPYNDPIQSEPKQSKMYTNPDSIESNKPGTSERPSEPKTPSEPEMPPESNPFETTKEQWDMSEDSLKFRACKKMAEEQIKQPGMNIDSIDIVPRVLWNAAEPKYTIPLTKPIKSVLATFTGTTPCFDDVDCKRIIQNLQTTQMEQLNMPDIQWNFMIGGTGKVYEGRGFDTLATKPPHYERVAEDSLDIAYIGNNEVEQLKPCMFASLNGLIAWAMDEGHVTKPFVYLQDSPQYRKIMQLN